MEKNERKGSMIILLADIVSIVCAFYLSLFIRHRVSFLYLLSTRYNQTLFVILLSYIVLFEAKGQYINIFKRGFLDELIGVIKEQTKLYLLLLLYLVFAQEGTAHSRIFLALFFVLSTLIIYVVRSYIKLIMLAGYKKSSSSSKVMLITLERYGEKILDRILREYEWQIYISSIAILDKDMVGEKILDVTVLANKNTLFEVAKVGVVDEVFIHLPQDYDLDLNEIILEFEKMGIIVHLNLDIYNNMKVKEKRVNSFGSYQVITFQTTMFEERQIFLKRVLDVMGGIVGLFFTVILTVILSPIIWIESKGPIFFSQMRVGKNGRIFKIYKFRSMYPDAEERKKELMSQNEMKGLMFKMKDDPRITKVGKFIRKTSLDEFPQFLNVLRGDMSLVGTRPPTMDEFKQYESRHKRRLSLKPGLTGMWQVSGRSDIDDFEEVVRLDLEYIDNWSLVLDVKLIFKTIWIVMFGKGSR